MGEHATVGDDLAALEWHPGRERRKDTPQIRRLLQRRPRRPRRWCKGGGVGIGVGGGDLYRRTIFLATTTTACKLAWQQLRVLATRPAPVTHGRNASCLEAYALHRDEEQGDAAAAALLWVRWISTRTKATTAWCGARVSWQNST